jgi:heat-inducible transcriptional repressor
MDKRKELILRTIIKEHIKTATPVGSSVLAEKYKLNISSATIRNEMAELEKEGFIAQPHTSAGRVPTEAAYRLYIESLKVKEIREKDKISLNEALGKKDEVGFKKAAKELAEKSGNAVFWAFHKHNLYYTGISNLFSQPEFSNTNLILDISTVIDRIDEIISEIYNDLKYGEQILLGSENPFGNFCSSIIIKYKKGDYPGLFGILGPMRMDYEKNLGLVKFIGEKLI